MQRIQGNFDGDGAAVVCPNKSSELLSASLNTFMALYNWKQGSV